MTTSSQLGEQEDIQLANTWSRILAERAAAADMPATLGFFKSERMESIAAYMARRSASDGNLSQGVRYNGQDSAWTL